MHPLEKQSEQNRAPPDKHRGGVKICDRRTPVQHHAKDQPGGVQRERDDQQANGRAAKRPRTPEPINASQECGAEIKDQCVVKERRTIEECFAGSVLCVRRETVGIQPAQIFSQRFSKWGFVFLLVSGDNPAQVQEGLWNAAGPESAEERVANAGPSLRRIGCAGLGQENANRVAERCHLPKFTKILGSAYDFFARVFLRYLVMAHAFDHRRKSRLKLFERALEAGGEGRGVWQQCAFYSLL